MIKNFIRNEEGQTATEYMLIISVIVIAVVAAAYLFLPFFANGVNALGGDVQQILSDGMIDGTGQAR